MEDPAQSGEEVSSPALPLDGNQQQISLGLEQIVAEKIDAEQIPIENSIKNRASTVASVGTELPDAQQPEASAPSTVPFRASDPLSALYHRAEFSQLRSAVESDVESTEREKLTAGKLWWLTASLKLEVPEPFLLGAIAEIESGSIPRATELGAFVEFVAEIAREQGASLVETELRRVLASRIAAAPSNTAQTNTGQTNTDQTSTIHTDQPPSETGAHQNNHRWNTNRANAEGKPGSSRSAILLIAIVVAAGYLLLTEGNRMSALIGQFSAPVGELSRPPSVGAELVTKEALSQSVPELVGPVLATAAPPTALDQVLSRLNEGTAQSSAGQSSSVVASSAAALSVPGPSQPSGAIAGAQHAPQTGRVAVRTDGPIEPERVRRAIEQGDPTESQRDQQVADRLFGGQQPKVRVREQDAFGQEERDRSDSAEQRDERLDTANDQAPPDQSDPEQASEREEYEFERFGRLRSYRIIVRTMVTKEARFTARRVSNLQPGARVFADGLAGPFLRIRMPSGITAYILAQDAEPFDP